MKKTNILFIYGFNDGPESQVVSYLENILPKRYNVISDYYAQYNPVDALIDLNNHINNYKIDVVIGENIGAYLSLFLDKNVKKILVNPIVNAKEELKKFDASKGEDQKFIADHIVDFYTDFENTNPKIHQNNSYYIYSENSEDILEKIKEFLDIK